MAAPDFENSNVLVLGGSGRLGSLIAAELARRGAGVVLAGRDFDRLQRHAGPLGPRADYVVFDLRTDDPEHLVNRAIDRLGGLTGVVNAAGVVAFGSLVELSDDDLEHLVEVDFIAPLRLMRAAVPHLDGGFLVNITGVVAEQPVAGLVAYSAAKAALSAATRALALELRRNRIHVLDARPPHTETGLAQRPIAGTAPPLPEGLDPSSVAVTIVDGLASGVRELPAEAFG